MMAPRSAPCWTRWRDRWRRSPATVHTTSKAFPAPSPSAILIVPPRSTAVASETAEIVPAQRDRHLQFIAEHGRAAWQKASGYAIRARAEAVIGRFKQVIGDGLRWRTPPLCDRGGRRRPCSQPYAGTETPDPRPHRLKPDRVETALSIRLIDATRSRNDAAIGSGTYVSRWG